MELCAYHDDNPPSLQILNSFLESVSVINIDEKVKINAIRIRKNAKLKLPDSIIAASALAYKLPLISADKGRKKIDNIDLVLYQKD